MGEQVDARSYRHIASRLERTPDKREVGGAESTQAALERLNIEVRNVSPSPLQSFVEDYMVKQLNAGCSSVGESTCLASRGQEFESLHLHWF